MYRETLRSLRSRVQLYRPDLSAAVIDRLINDRIREVIDSRPYWTDLLSARSFAIAPAVSEGRVTVTNGSDAVQGDGTNWPVGDVYSGQITEDEPGIGYVRLAVSPVPREQDVIGRWAVVTSNGEVEICPVVQISGNRMVVKTTTPKATGATVTISSLSGRRFRADNSYTWYTVTGVFSETWLSLSNVWTGGSASGIGYLIADSLVRMPPDTKAVLDAVNMRDGFRLSICHSARDGVTIDPRRESIGESPIVMIEHETDPTGVIVYELWPAPTSAMELRVIYARYWPILRNDNDPAPWFIEGAVFAYGAIADALRIKRGSEDTYYNPALAREFEAQYMRHLLLAQNADEQKAVKDYFSMRERYFGGSAEFWQRTEPVVLEWEF